MGLQDMASWRQRLVDCSGIVSPLDAPPATPTTPANIVIADRDYNEGGHVLNLDAALATIKAKHGNSSSIKVAYLEVSLISSEIVINLSRTSKPAASVPLHCVSSTLALNI